MGMRKIRRLAMATTAISPERVRALSPVAVILYPLIGRRGDLTPHAEHAETIA